MFEISTSDLSRMTFWPESSFSKGPLSTLFEGPGPSAGPLCKVYLCDLATGPLLLVLVTGPFVLYSLVLLLFFSLDLCFFFFCSLNTGWSKKSFLLVFPPKVAFYDILPYFSGGINSRPGRFFWHQYGLN